MTNRKLLSRRQALRVRAAAPFTQVALAGGASGLLAACGRGQKPPERLSDAQVVEASIATLQEGMAKGVFSARSLVTVYLDRIAAIDKQGPALSSIIETNPDALAMADALDAERRRTGPRGPLHGIPILLKDNIDTDDKMETTAGSLALLDSRPARDADVARRLREAGAILLGKANLSEWSNYRSGNDRKSLSRNGWSARGGCTLNPYCRDADPLGSSSGSAVAVSANLTVAALGTETAGSILAPASASGVVGLKPTVGLTSRAGVIPISPVMDSVGPIARTVEDVAILLGTIAGIDPRDAATQRVGARPRDYRVFLEKDRLRGAVIGKTAGGDFSADLLRQLEDAGATVVDIEGSVVEQIYEQAVASLPLPIQARHFDVMLTMRYEFKDAIATYLASRRARMDGTPPAVRTLKDVIAFNRRTPAERLAQHDQAMLEEAEAAGGITTPEYVEQRLYNDTIAHALLDGVFAAFKLDAIVGDRVAHEWGTFAAAAGYPQIAVPYWPVAGATLPSSVVFTAKPYGEPALIGLAYSLEQHFRQTGAQRRVPRYLASC